MTTGWLLYYAFLWQLYHVPFFEEITTNFNPDHSLAFRLSAAFFATYVTFLTLFFMTNVVPTTWKDAYWDDKLTQAVVIMTSFGWRRMMGMAVNAGIKGSFGKVDGTASNFLEIAANLLWVLLIFPATDWYMVPMTFAAKA